MSTGIDISLGFWYIILRHGLFSLLSLLLPSLWLRPAPTSSHSSRVQLTHEDHCKFGFCLFQCVVRYLPRFHTHQLSATPKPSQENTNRKLASILQYRHQKGENTFIPLVDPAGWCFSGMIFATLLTLWNKFRGGYLFLPSQNWMIYCWTLSLIWVILSFSFNRTRWEM